jgi:ferritin
MYSLDMKAEKLLTKAIDSEWVAHAFYQDAGIHMRYLGYNIASEFAYNESKDEAKHARKIQDFLADLGVPFSRSMPEMNYKFDNYKEFIEQALELESNLLEQYETSYKELSDCPTAQALILEFITIQTNAVREYMDIYSQLEDITTPFELRTLEPIIFKTN